MRFLFSLLLFLLGLAMLIYAVRIIWGSDAATLTAGVLFFLGGMNGIRNDAEDAEK